MCQGSVDSIFRRKMELYRETVWSSDEWADFRLALMELRVVLARLIWNFDISLKEVGQAEPTFDHRSVAAGKLWLRLRDAGTG
jgi:hypothetical protein